MGLLKSAIKWVVLVLLLAANTRVFLISPTSTYFVTGPLPMPPIAAQVLHDECQPPIEEVHFKVPPITDTRIGAMLNATRTMLDKQLLLKDSFVRAMVVTTWRSGSTLTGELLNAYPGSFYNYEPLSFAGITRIYNTSNEVDSAKAIIKALFSCNYTIVQNIYQSYRQDYTNIAGGELITRNKLIQPFCGNPTARNTICSTPEFLDNMCALSKVHVMKTVRLGLEVVIPLMEDLAFAKHTKVVFIARDPRGLFNSRKGRNWCVRTPRCIKPKHICQDLVKDYRAAQVLIRLHGREQINIVRYEELSLDIWNASKNLLNYLNLDMQPEIEDFLKHHTQQDKFSAHPEVWNTFRDPKQAPIHWKKDLSFTEVVHTQQECWEAMQLWGYRVVHNARELIKLEPLLTLDLNQ